MFCNEHIERRPCVRPFPSRVAAVTLACKQKTKEIKVCAAAAVSSNKLLTLLTEHHVQSDSR